MLFVLMQPGRAVAQAGAGSAVPCAVPIRWTLTDIDSGFGITRAQAETALSEAFGL
jgi:hypothetical protein